MGFQDSKKLDVAEAEVERGGRYEALVVGGGIGGIYAAYCLSQLGLSFRVLEAGTGVGGTWYWNRYPGARCDTDSLDYSYSFSPELEQEWTWTERYASQPEILAYLDHVVDRFDLRKYFIFESRVTSAIYNEASATWRVVAGDDVYEARYVLMATGFLSTPLDPDIPGLKQFAGETYFASRWPKHEVELSGKRVGVIGTGSSGIQLIPAVARQAASVTVFQRTPNYSVPATNGPVDPEQLKDYRKRYREIREAERRSWLGTYWSTFEANGKSAKSVTPEERLQEFEWRWNRGGQGFMVAFSDIMTDLEVNKECADYVRSKIKGIVQDPAKLQALLPPEEDAIACKRLCVDTDYFDTYNQEHVNIIDLRKTPIRLVEPQGVRTTDRLYECDVLVLATGFDAFTGALAKMEIRGLGGVQLKEKWRDRPASYLGVLTAGFPNMFHINGPFTVVGNGVTTTEMLVEQISKLIAFAEKQGTQVVDTTVEDENRWTDETQEVAKSMPALFACKSWLFGANVPGKPALYLTYFGGLAPYHDRWDAIAREGYKGFTLQKVEKLVTAD
jgi:cation diffusion facilitator CzcD-associated flavoprotein CzcO